MALDPYIKLSDGHRMPVVGLGTSKLLERDVLSALRAGVRHLDCARMYRLRSNLDRARSIAGL